MHALELSSRRYRAHTFRSGQPSSAVLSKASALKEDGPLIYWYCMFQNLISGRVELHVLQPDDAVECVCWRVTLHCRILGDCDVLNVAETRIAYKCFSLFFQSGTSQRSSSQSMSLNLQTEDLLLILQNH